MPNLQSIKETEQREFEKEFNVHRTYKHFNGELDVDTFLNPITPTLVQNWLKAHDLRLEKAIREDERERVVEDIERRLNLAYNYPCLCSRANILCEHKWADDFFLFKKVLSSLQEKQ